jgi:hypothetical protein
MSQQDDDTVCNTSGNTHFNEILRAHLTRRQVLMGGFGALALGFLSVPGCGNGSSDAPAPAASATTATNATPQISGPAITFESVSPSLEDAVRVPSGYTARVLYAWGDPISDPALAFKFDASNTADEQEQQSGMHHDGMTYFALTGVDGKPANTRGLLAINHEYTDDGLLHVGGTTAWSADKVRKSQAAHGVSIIEVQLGAGGQWEVVRPSRYARRIHGYTPMRISGPAAGADLMKTAADPTGTAVLGTINNCANGYTPWGTYLTCEENWNGYFVNPTGDVVGLPGNDQKLEILRGQSRYGITTTGFGYRWHEFDTRFDASANPNEPNRFGYVVEIDPYDPSCEPVKRTALGRFKHEGAVTVLANDNRVVVYMGCDERNEYIYKFVTRDAYNATVQAANANLLDDGTLYVAKFNADGTGQWLALTLGQNGLTPGNGFATQAEICIKTRQAADRAGATMMDRPEWIATHPVTKEVYCTLTNNNRRGTAPASANAADGTTSAGSARPTIDPANPRSDNIYGHIIRWREAGGDAAATAFQWDVFIQCGDPADPGRDTTASPNPRANYAGNIDGDAFGSPDGLWFDKDARLWIQTDISTSVVGFATPSTTEQRAYRNIGNNQMLCADAVTKKVKRFLTGPQKCEVTGVTTTPDGQTMFVNIQHPGETSSERTTPGQERAISNWPDFRPDGRPRSATIVITKNGGGVIGT